MTATTLKKQPQDEFSHELLWVKFINDDINAFHLIYSENYRLLFSYALRFINDDILAEDCIQNMFLKILDSRKRLPEVRSVRAYLITSLRNQILQSNKKKIKNFPLIDELHYDYDNSGVDEEVYKQLTSLIGKLSPRESEIIYLKYFHSFKNAEISEMLGIEYQTARNTLASAIIKMRKLGKKTILNLFFLLFR